MTKKLKTLFSYAFLTSIVLVFAIGLIFTAEILWRSFGPVAPRGTLIDVALFPYKNYVVTTHPNNLELGNSNHILEDFFGKKVDTTPEGSTARFNSDGFRTHDLQNVPGKEPGEIRIIITGGSASISWNIGEAATLDNNLYRLFEKHYPNKKVRIFNLGNGAWKSLQELIAVQQYGLKLEPDLIIAFDGFNDIQHAYSMPILQPYSNHAEDASKRYDEWLTGSISELFKSMKIINTITHQKHNAVAMVGRVKNALAIPYPAFAKEPKPGKLGTDMIYPLDLHKIKARTDFDPYNQQVVDFYLNNERMMAKSASAVGARMMVVLQPILYAKIPHSASEKRALDSYAPSVNFVMQGYERMKEGLGLLAADEKNVSFYDMSNVFENDSQSYFGDYCHFSREGYEKVANILFSQITEILHMSQ